MTRVPLILFGLGQVGCAFLRQLLKSGAVLSRRLSRNLLVVGVADRHSMVFDPAGLRDEQLMALAEGKETGQTLLDQKDVQIKLDNQRLLDALLCDLDEPPIVIDATAAEGMGPVLLNALDRGCCLAL